MIQGIDCIIFDLDGTISDPSEGIAKCVNHALGRYGYKPVDPDRVAPLIGPPLTEIFEQLLGVVADDRMLDLVDTYRERYAKIGYRENVLYDGIGETVRLLHHSGYRLGICTSKRADYAVKIVDMFGLGSYFEFVDGGDVHIKKYMQLERLVSNGLDARSAVMIGDRAVDIEAGQRNGLSTVAVSWGFGSSEELARAAPDRTARIPPDLLELIK
jgi:phosphoglycolate phosphatase